MSKRVSDYITSEEESIMNFTLPEGYGSLPKEDRAEVLRSSIMLALNVRGTATGMSRSELKSLIDPKDTVNHYTWSNALEFLVTTQQIYYDAAPGSRDPIFYPNGRMAHPKMQKTLDTWLHKYVVRAYDGRLGKTITLTQYTKSVSGEDIPISGIRVDWQDLGGLIKLLREELTEMKGTGEVLEENEK
jgi:hypothetical protein